MLICTKNIRKQSRVDSPELFLIAYHWFQLEVLNSVTLENFGLVIHCWMGTMLWIIKCFEWSLVSSYDCPKLLTSPSVPQNDFSYFPSGWDENSDGELMMECVSVTLCLSQKSKPCQVSVNVLRIRLNLCLKIIAFLEEVREDIYFNHFIRVSDYVISSLIMMSIY